MFTEGWFNRYVRSFSMTIAGGTSEIQRNIVAEHVLGLPAMSTNDEGVAVAESYPARVRAYAASDPDAIVVRHVATDGTETSLTWRELDRRSDALARVLRDQGLGFAGRLGMAMPNSLQLVLATVAAWKLGAVPVPVRWDLPDWERERLRETVDAAVYLDESHMALVDGWIDERMARSPARADLPDDLPDAVSPSLMGICSSGSTGMPKVIVINRPAVYHDVFTTPMMAMWGPVPQPQTILVVAPMYHSTGFTTLSNMLGGDHLVILQKFDAARIVDVIERHRITHVHRHADDAQADRRPARHRRAGPVEHRVDPAGCGADAAEPRRALDRADRCRADPDGLRHDRGARHHRPRGDEWLEHRGSVGLPLRGTEVRILGPDGAELPPGETGDIYMQAPAYGGSTYLGAGALDVNTDGLATVGDMGHVDDDGYLYLADRRVDLILSGGANVFPAEVEAALIDHPAVADVVVIGLRDPEWGQRVHAIIEPKEGAAPPSFDDVVAFAKSRLAAYKVPKSVEIVDVIPRSAATKVNRGALVAERRTLTSRYPG